MYLPQIIEHGSRNSEGTMNELVSVHHNPSIRGKNKLREWILEEIRDEPGSFFSDVSVAIFGPSGTGFKEFVSSTIAGLSEAHSDVSVALSVPMASANEIRKLVGNNAVTIHDFSYNFDSFPAMFIEHFAEEGVELTERQARYIRNRSDLDPEIIGESYRTLLSLGQASDDKKITNQMVRSTISNKVGVSSVFDFDDAIAGGKKSAIEFAHRLLNQKQATSMSLQLLTANVNKLRAICLLQGGLSTSEVSDVTSYTRKDGSIYSMSSAQLGYLGRNAVKQNSRECNLGLLQASSRALAALKGGPGSSAGRQAILYDYAIECAELIERDSYSGQRSSR